MTEDEQLRPDEVKYTRELLAAREWIMRRYKRYAAWKVISDTYRPSLAAITALVAGLVAFRQDIQEIVAWFSAF